MADNYVDLPAEGGGSSGANTSLSNLTSPTAINKDLVFDTGADAIITTQNSVTTSNGLLLRSGTSSANDGGVISIIAGDGDTSGGSIILAGGSAGDGTPSRILFKNSDEGTSGHVWTSVGTRGAGHWAAPNVSQLTSKTTLVLAGVTVNAVFTKVGSIVNMQTDAFNVASWPTHDAILGDVIPEGFQTDPTQSSVSAPVGIADLSIGWVNIVGERISFYKNSNKADPTFGAAYNFINGITITYTIEAIT